MSPATASAGVLTFAGYGTAAASTFNYNPPACFFVHTWTRRGRDEVCSHCGLRRLRGVDVSRKNTR